jgi:hypothetical protein
MHDKKIKFETNHQSDITEMVSASDRIAMAIESTMTSDQKTSETKTAEAFFLSCVPIYLEFKTEQERTA